MSKKDWFWKFLNNHLFYLMELNTFNKRDYVIVKQKRQNKYLDTLFLFAEITRIGANHFATIIFPTFAIVDLFSRIDLFVYPKM